MRVTHDKPVSILHPIRKAVAKINGSILLSICTHCNLNVSSPRAMPLDLLLLYAIVYIYILFGGPYGNIIKMS